MILHMIRGLSLEGYQAHNFDGLMKILNNHTITHVFIAQAEYLENSSFYEDLAGKLQVVVIAEREFMLNRGSKLLVIHKPFFALSVVNLLNGEVTANGFEEAQAAGRKPFSCEGVRVLAVDDEEMNLVVAKGVLGSYGIQVDTCLSGREAIDRCANVSYDIVFLDHMMPGFDGVETLKQIREINNGAYKDLPIIALTANTISGAREMFRNEGFTEFIPKPIDRAVLERVLRKVLPIHHVQYSEAPVTHEEPEPPQIPAPSDSSNEKRKRKKKRKKRPLTANAFETDSSAPIDLVSKKTDSNKSVPKKAAAKEMVVDDRHSEDFRAEDVHSEGVGSEEFPTEDVRPEDFLAEDESFEDSPQEEDSLIATSSLPYDSLTQIGINVQLGLDYCCGEEEFYKEMLRMFCSQAPEKKSEIISLYDAANWADYTVKVHALKSTSLTIGAERLADQAKLLEQAGKQRNIEYIRHSHPILLRLYDEICDTLAGL